MKNLFQSEDWKDVASDVDGKGKHPRINYKTISHLEKDIITADKDAFYSKEIIIDLNSVQPTVAGPNNVKTITSLSRIKAQEVKINKAYLVSCVNSRLK